MAGIFRAYDIRGLYPSEINEDVAKRIGHVIPDLMGKGTIVVGRDMRSSSLSLFQSLTSGIMQAGSDVIDIGLISTPMINFATAHYHYDGGVMITASHNPKGYNGFKMCKKDAYPVSYETGISDIEAGVVKNNPVKSLKPGKIYTKDVLEDYVQHVLKFSKNIKKIKIVIDAGNGMGSIVAQKLFKYLPCEMIPLFFELDGDFPNHEPNPLKKENMRDLQKAVLEHKADLGAAFDGDADRVMFVDNEGEIVSADLATALIARGFLALHPGETILYDLRSSRIVKEEIEKHGGKAKMTRVGHAYIKQMLRKENGIFAGELSGHYYFRDNFFADSGSIALVMMLNLLTESNASLSKLLEPLKKYFSTGEVNYEVENPDKIMKLAENKYNQGDVYHMDGLSVEFKDWWFNLRKSNTEPLLRLNVEANTSELLKSKTSEIESLLQSHV